MQIPISLKIENFLTHQFVMGATGSGKSYLMLHEYIGLTAQPRTSVVMFSVEGNEVGIVKSLKDRNIILLDCGPNGNFAFDPLCVVDGSTPSESTDDFCRLFSTTFWLRIKGYAMIKPIIKELMEEKIRGNPKGLVDFYEQVKKLKGETRDVILNRLDILIDTPFFRSTKMPRMDILSKANIIFLIENLDSYAQTFFINLFINKLMRYKRAMREHMKDVSEQSINICIIDEAQRVTPASFIQREELAFHPLVQACNQGRKLGVGLIFIVQRPSVVESSFLAQAGLVLAGPIANEDDIRAVRMALGLDQEQLKYYLSMPKRTFLFKKTGINVFPITIPEFELHNTNINKAFINEWNAGIIKQNNILADLFSNEEKHKISKYIDTTTDSYKFIKAVFDNQCENMNFYYDYFHKNNLFRKQKANLIRRRLEEQYLIKSWQVNKGDGKFVKSIEITDKGYEFIGEEQNLKRSRGADFIHTFIVETVMDYYMKKGNTSKKEFLVGNHYMDICINNETAIEVAVGNQVPNEIQNIVKNYEHSFKTIVICNNQMHMNEIKSHLPNYLERSVEFKLFADFL